MDPYLLMVLEIGYFHSVSVSAALHRDEDENDPIVSDFAMLFNRERPPWSLDECADVLMELYVSKFIVFRAEQVHWLPSAPTVVPTRADVLSALQTPHGDPPPRFAPSLTYALTPDGGAAWEGAAQADWHRYVGEQEGYGLDWAEIFGAIDKEEEPAPLEEEDDTDELPPAEQNTDDAPDYMDTERAQVLLSGMNRDALEAIYRYEVETLRVVVPNSRQDAEIRPWHPVYWKTLPHGFRLGYATYSPPEMRALNLPVQTRDQREEAKGFTPNWYRSVFPPHHWSN